MGDGRLHARALPPSLQPPDYATMRPYPPASGGAVDILLVDDNPLMQQVIGRYLTDLGHCVAIAGRAEEALALAGQTPPSLLIVDYFLPDMDGPEALRALRSLPGCGAVPAIALSGMDEQEARETLTDEFDAILLKPVELNDLAAAVRRCAGRPQPRSAGYGRGDDSG